MEIAHHSDDDDDEEDEDWGHQKNNDNNNSKNKNAKNNKSNSSSYNSNNKKRSNNKSSKSNEDDHNKHNGSDDDNSEDEDEDDEIVVKKRKKTQSDSTISTKKQSSSSSSKPTSSALKDSKAPSKVKSKSKSLESTFVKPLPLHIQTLTSFKPTSSLTGANTNSHLSSSSSFSSHIHENKPISSAPSIQSLLNISTSSNSISAATTLPNNTSQLESQAQLQFSRDIFSWAIIIIKDKQLETLFETYFVELLNILNNENSLPSNNDNMVNVLHLIQYKLQINVTFNELNQSLLRNILPLIILYANDTTLTNEFDISVIENYFINTENLFNQQQFINFILKIFHLYKEKLQNGHSLTNNSNKSDNILESSLLNI